MSTTAGGAQIVRKALIGGGCGYVFGSPVVDLSSSTPPPITDPFTLGCAFALGIAVSSLADCATWPIESLSQTQVYTQGCNSCLRFCLTSKA